MSMAKHKFTLYWSSPHYDLPGRFLGRGFGGSGRGIMGESLEGQFPIPAPARYFTCSA